MALNLDRKALAPSTQQPDCCRRSSALRAPKGSENWCLKLYLLLLVVILLYKTQYKKESLPGTLLMGIFCDLKQLIASILCL